MINEQQFEELWARAEAEGSASRLAAQYPAWRARRRRTAGVVAGVALVLAVVTPLASPSTQIKSYGKVYSNNTSFSDQHWAEMAATLLTKA